MSSMNALLIYALAGLLVAVLSLVVLYNFLRYRFTGDKTFVFLGLFVVLFVGSVGFTLAEYLQVDGSAPAAISVFR